MITKNAIENAMQQLSQSEKGRVELRDDGERGEGRLVMILRRFRSSTSAEWYAQSYVEGARSLAKIGRYPEIQLDEARRLFAEQYLPEIMKGGGGVGQDATAKRPTLREMLEAYVQRQEGLGKPSASQARWVLLRRKGSVRRIPKRGLRAIAESGAAEGIGEDMAAGDVRAHHIIPYLRSIVKRGCVVHADGVRAQLRAAFAFGLTSVNNYHEVGGGIDWGLTFNPVADIKPNPAAHRAGDRFLTEKEFGHFWNWLAGHAERNTAAAALQLILVTGQRPGEILQLSVDHYDATESMVHWRKTKNGHPHTLPLPAQAVEVLQRLKPNAAGLYFPKRFDGTARKGTYVLVHLVHRYLDETGAKHFASRDLRRTWMTLTGNARISKEIRDRLQNHRLSDVSSKHYDRCDYLRDGREAMEQWSRYVCDVIMSVPAAGEAAQAA